jgi:esterase
MKLFVRRFGQGFPVIILHGLFGLSDNWVSLGRRLAADFDVILPDLRNHGQSPHSAVFDYPSMADDVSELLNELQLTECFMVGHSLGGKVAMQYGFTFPERLRKLVIVDIGLRKYTEHRQQKELIDAMLSVDFTGLTSRTEIEKNLREHVSSEKLRQFLLKNAYWRDRDHLAWRINLEAINKNLPRIFESILPEKVFTRPALFIRGGLSGYLPDSEIDEIHKWFSDSRIETIENATHWVHADEPEKFFATLSAFLKE